MSTKRYLVLLFDGTWASRTQGNSIIHLFTNFLKTDHNNVYPIYVSGVGSRPSIKDRVLGGAVGWGLKDKLLEAFSELANLYRPGDVIIMIGYSRGAYLARSLAGFINAVGIPRRPDNKLYRKLFKLYTGGRLNGRNVATRIRGGYPHHSNVEIAFLGCFDTVCSLTIPKTGILSVLKLVDWVNKDMQFHQTNPARNIRRSFHALSLDERVAPFQATLMHVPQHRSNSVEQRWLMGTHRDLGQDVAGTGLVDFAIAAMLQAIKNATPDFPFNEVEIGLRFPAYRNAADLVDDNMSIMGPAVDEPVRRTDSALRRLTGISPRTPGQYNQPGLYTCETIDRSASERTRRTGKSAVAGFDMQEDNGRVVWINRKDPSIRIPEAVHGEFEAQLLGWDTEALVSTEAEAAEAATQS